MSSQQRFTLSPSAVQTGSKEMMKKLVAPALTCFVLFLVPASAGATIILDQSNTEMGALYLNQGIGGPTAAFGDPVVAQSFTAGVAGTLASIDIFVVRNASPNVFGTDLVASIFSASASLPSGAALASVVVPELSLPGGVQPDPTLINVDFSTFAIPVAIGSEFAIVLNNSQDDPSTVYTWAGSNGDSYSGGRRSIDIGSGFFAPSCYFCGDPDPTTDLYFQTFVLVPEPNTALLLGFGLVGLGIQKRRAVFD